MAVVFHLTISSRQPCYIHRKKFRHSNRAVYEYIYIYIYIACNFLDDNNIRLISKFKGIFHCVNIGFSQFVFEYDISYYI